MPKAAGMPRVAGVLAASVAPLSLAMTLAMTLAIAQAKALAHQTQISDGVGGTHHIEPNDTPRAGEPSQTWFALTQVGGQPIGLSDCDCELVLAEVGGEAIATPPLSAIAVEGLTDVPGAELTFPQVGAYVLTLTGRPRGAADFPSFRLDFPVTVAGGKAIAEQAVPQEAGATEAAGQPGKGTGTGQESGAELEPDSAGEGSAHWRWMGLMAGGIALAVAVFGLARRKKSRELT